MEVWTDKRKEIKMKYQYQNWSTIIFMGFYESPLYYCDTEYYINENMDDDNTYEIDWDPYTQTVCKGACDELYTCINHDDNIILDMDYVGMSSPKYYNYSTDKLNIDMKLNLRNLKRYVKDNKEDFNLYLKDNFTSYDGFTSFISNNYNEFVKDYKEDFCGVDKDRCINVMVEYYLLRCIYDDNWEGISKQIKNGYEFETYYHNRLFDINNEAQYNNLKVVESAFA